MDFLITKAEDCIPVIENANDPWARRRIIAHDALWLGFSREFRRLRAVPRDLTLYICLGQTMESLLATLSLQRDSIDQGHPSLGYSLGSSLYNCVRTKRMKCRCETSTDSEDFEYLVSVSFCIIVFTRLIEVGPYSMDTYTMELHPAPVLSLFGSRATAEYGIAVF